MEAATGYGIKTNFNHDLVAIDGSAPDFIKKKPFGYSGWLGRFEWQNPST